jgi:hypothetical protein
MDPDARYYVLKIYEQRAVDLYGMYIDADDTNCCRSVIYDVKTSVDLIQHHI